MHCMSVKINLVQHCYAQEKYAGAVGAAMTNRKSLCTAVTVCH